jgi:hypothetical protein
MLNTQTNFMNENKHIIQCLAKDGLKHYCYVDSEQTLCNKPVARKKLLKNDFMRFCCIECDYSVEILCGE